MSQKDGHEIRAEAREMNTVLEDKLALSKSRAAGSPKPGLTQSLPLS